ncbi:hypothetical protein CRUP_009398 [Coryphaenoides rupestris]|nr:hypothetical protein CRUP_009398 [Coryphaenoides rupestris]
MVSNLSQRVAELEGQLDRANRERTSLTNQLEETLRKLTNQEQESTKMCVELRGQLSQAVMKREETQAELRELAAKTSRQTERAAQEVEKLSSVLVGCQHRLEAVQKDGSQWQSEALSLAEQLASTQRQLHLTRQEKESADRCHGEDMESVRTSARRRESELAAHAQQLELQHEHQVKEMDGLLTSQNSLIGKLKEECCMLGARLEELRQNSRCRVKTYEQFVKAFAQSILFSSGLCSREQPQVFCDFLLVPGGAFSALRVVVVILLKARCGRVGSGARGAQSCRGCRECAHPGQPGSRQRLPSEGEASSPASGAAGWPPLQPASQPAHPPIPTPWRWGKLSRMPWAWNGRLQQLDRHCQYSAQQN